ncbi:gamma-glutamyltranspeptidase [Dictyocaulus viviparus]|uniref:Gamma-glutamyltranspeptidase n=1 Tax=Dictyocaulus viviparus TaxID=29172 RepID=A0A0D8XUG0_DICVI|nr:gamma-glutamyltranspeptidase [Dictyocaulus viviparus]
MYYRRKSIQSWNILCVVVVYPEGAAAQHIEWPSPSGSLYAHFRKAAVASDHGLCSEIGRDVLIDGGNAVDSMIATLLCIGVVNPQSSGLGGGFLMTLYNASTGRCQTINARESAPLAATTEMFVNDSTESIYGYRAIATPSELHGFWTVFQKFGSGKISWSRLFEPSINLAINGFPVSSNLAMQLNSKESLIQAEPTMKEIFVNPASDRVYEEGDIMTRKSYGFTLQLIANATDPVELFYKGGMAQTIAGEITDNGGHIDQKDLASYETLIDEIPLISTGLSGDLEMCGPPPPSSFVITQNIIAVMAEFYRGGKVDLNDPLVYHRLIEAEKFAYAQRTKLGDVRFVDSAKLLVANMTTPKYAKWIASMIKDTAQSQDYYLGDMTSQVIFKIYLNRFKIFKF